MILSRADWCDEMKAAVDDPAVAFYYLAPYRQLVLPDICNESTPADHGFPVRCGSLMSCFAIFFCPWSGELLPGDVRNEFLRDLKKVFGMKDPSLHFDRSILTEDYLGEAWWLKKGFGARVNRARRIREARAYRVLPYCWTDPMPLYGIYRAGERPPHYCGSISDVFDDHQYTPITYLPFTREYGFLIFDLNKRVGDQPVRIFPIRYCPWCGERLPGSLREGWESRVRARGLDPSTPETLPPDLRSGDWWREAGI